MRFPLSHWEHDQPSARVSLLYMVPAWSYSVISVVTKSASTGFSGLRSSDLYLTMASKMTLKAGVPAIRLCQSRSIS